MSIKIVKSLRKFASEMPSDTNMQHDFNCWERHSRCALLHAADTIDKLEFHIESQASIIRDLN